MRVSLQPHITLLELQYPVDDLRIQLDEAADSRALARRMMRPSAPGLDFLAVHRVEFEVFYRRLREEFAFLDSLRNGAAMGSAGTACPNPPWSRHGSRTGRVWAGCVVLRIHRDENNRMAL